MLVMDAKSLYDALNTEQQSNDESRSALEAIMVKEDLERLVAVPRWIPHDRNPADALTKVEKAHAKPLEDLLKTHTFVLAHEDSVMAERVKEREEHGYNPRRHESNIRASGSLGSGKKRVMVTSDQATGKQDDGKSVPRDNSEPNSPDSEKTDDARPDRRQRYALRQK